MTTEPVLDVKMLNDKDLAAFVAAGQAEIAAREKQRKEETIAKIRALASQAGLAVQIAGARGRPGGTKAAQRPATVATERASAVTQTRT